MKVFISYGSAADQVTALRLQALAAVNGLTVAVPPAYTPQELQPVLDPQSAQKLNDTEILLGVVGSGLSEACRQELNTWIALHKTTIVMTDPAIAPQLAPHFGANLLVIDLANPDRAEFSIVQHLKAVDAEQTT